MVEHRAVFDFRITFVNGGEITGRDFRLDVPSRNADRSAVGALLVRHLGLLMVDRVELDPFRIVEEPHRGGRGVESAAVASRRIVELSHTIREGMVAGTGTYLDSSFHRDADGPDLGGMPLDRMVDLEGVVVRVAGSPARRAVDALQLAPLEVSGRAVLVHTGWDRHGESPAHGQANPYLTRAAARWLVEQEAALVGIDSVDIDDVEDRTRPARSILLAARIPIVEHLRGLDRLPPEGFRFHAAPPAVEGLGTFPVRAYAVIDTTR